MTAFDEAWDFLKADESYTGQPKFGGNQKQPIDMQEYPPGSGHFMPLKDMIEARNADARKNIQASKLPITPNPNTNTNTDYPPIPNTVMVNGKEMDRKNFYNQNKNNIMVSPTGNLSDIPEEQRWNPL
tara:strand:- start:9893 stop:10276 length:384 start_codon:yes stop_codon:yes gene_type:complete